MPQVDRLLYAFDANYTLLWTFAKGQEFNQPLERPTATTALPFIDYGYNPLGTRAAAVAQTTIKWQFVYPYDATYPNWSALQKGLTKAFGHGRPLILEKLDADGVILDAGAVCTSVPRDADMDAPVFARFTLSFEQREAWRGPYPTGWAVFDVGLLFDNSVLYDNQTSAQVTTTAQNNNFSLVQAGNTIERDVILQFNGPMSGPILLINYSLDGRGQPVADPNNNPNALYLLINDTLATGEYYVVDCRTGAVFTNRPGTGWANLSVQKGQRGYFALGALTNQCTLALGAATPTGGVLSATYHDRYA